MNRSPSLVAVGLLAIIASAARSPGSSITFQNGALPDSSYAGCQDNWIYSLYPTVNYGTNTWGNGIGNYSNGIKRSVIKFDVSSVPSTATVTSATLRLMMNTIGANRTVEAYQVLQPWTQTGSTWNNYASGLAWSTAGCDASGVDRASTTAGSVNVTTSQANTWIEISLSTSLVQGWVNGTIANNGVLLKDTVEATYEMRFRAENYTTVSERPQLVVEYSLDTTAPSAVADLAAGSPTSGSLNLIWTAPGDDGNTGTAASYDIRYSTSTITEVNWTSAMQVTGEPAPAAAGTNQNMTVAGLSADTIYYFAVKTTDDYGNVSLLSNIATARTSDVTAPGTVSNLSAGSPTGTSITLTWTAPGDDDSTGTATSYDIRYSTSTITEVNWASATQVTSEPAPVMAGTNQNMTISGLTSGTTYYFAIKASDEVPNTSALSNVASATTLDVIAPAAVTDLIASNATSTTITLNWTAPGDDDSTGAATSYDIRYSTSTITDATWGSATQVTGEPAPAMAGTNQNMTISGLTSGMTYYFVMKASDEVPNTSSLSNVASGLVGLTLHVDLGKSGSNVGPATGYTLLLDTNRFDNATQVLLGNGVTAGYLHAVTANWGYRDRGASYSTLLRDFATFNITITDPIEVRGLPAGPYTLTIFGYDPQYKSSRTMFDIDGNHDGSADLSVSVFNTLNEQQKSAIITVNATGILTISPYGSGVTGCFNGFDLVSGAMDIVAPAAVTNLATSSPSSNSVVLTWAAPGDDDNTGTATSYDVRYSTSSITEGNWASATQVSNEPVPAAAGTGQSMTVSGLTVNTTYYFALKTTDDLGNLSALSNVPSTLTVDITAPAAVANLAASNIASNSLTLTWTAPGDDNNAGTAAIYDIRYSYAPITSANWASAMPLSGEPTPAVAGTNQSMTVSGLAAETTYYFAMKTSDEVPNISALSNIASGTTTASGLPVDVPLIVEERTGVARTGEIFSGGVPFAVGKLTDIANLHVENAQGQTVPAQIQILDRWWSPRFDNSIKWLQVTFPADVAASGSSTYYLRPGSNPAPTAPVNVSVNGSVHTVTTGPLKVTINQAAFKLFDQVWLDANSNGTFEGSEQIVSAATSDGVVITAGEFAALGIAAGDEFRSGAGTATVTVEESGPVRAVLCVQGTLQRSGGPVLNPYYEYAMRLHFAAGSPSVRCQVAFKNNRIVNSTVYTWPVEDLTLRTSLASLTGGLQYALLGQTTPVRGTVGSNVVKMYQDSNGTDEWQTYTNYVPPYDEIPIPYVAFRGYQMLDGATTLEQNNQAKGWIDLNNGALGCAAGVKSFWQQYPKAMRVNGSRLEAGLLPAESAEVYSLRDGSSKIHDVIYNFHSGSLADQQINDACLKAERPLHFRCPPSVYVNSKAWDLGLGLISPPTLDSYDKYDITTQSIGKQYSWRWYGKFCTGYNDAGGHSNETSQLMWYVLWGDWRKFERVEDSMAWSDLQKVVQFDQPNLSVNWHYLISGSGLGTGITETRYPGWTDWQTWGRGDAGHCGMLFNQEYYHLTGDRFALDRLMYQAQLSTFYTWPRFGKVPRYYSSYNGDVDDPNFMISNRYYGWPVFGLVQAYEVTGDSSWLNDATISIRGFRNALRASPLKFTSEYIHPINDTSGAYAVNFPAANRALGASLGYAVFQMSLTMTKAAGMYYAATGDMDAYDLIVAHGDFLCDYAANRDASGNIVGWPYCWGDYWGSSESNPTTFHEEVAAGLGTAAKFARKPQFLTDVQRVWAACSSSSYGVLGYLMQVVNNPDPDQTPPAAVNNLAATPGGTGTINVSWTAPGDNGTSGTAAYYQLKYSASPIVEVVTGWPDWTPPVPQTAADWSSRSQAFLVTQRPFVSAINVLNLPIPAVAGTAQSKAVTGLISGVRYYFSIKTLDVAGNLSSISNVVSAVAP